MNCGNKFISLVRTLICHGYTYVFLFFSIALINAKVAVLTSFKNGLNKIFLVIGVSIKPGQIEIASMP